MRTLLVASSGGHLAELHTLLPRFGNIGDVEWVTFDNDQTRNLLKGEVVHLAPHATSRDVPGTLRCAAFARQLFNEKRYDRVISTGASIAAAFLPVAAKFGSETHYIESATRSFGPSATGRIVTHVPGVRTYTQSPRWASRKWIDEGSVFDSFTSHNVRKPRTVEKVVVTVGTHPRYGFRRLIEQLESVIPDDVEVLWQTGSTDVTGLGIKVVTQISESDLRKQIKAADVVVCHAGVGSALTAFECGKTPVYVPRTKSAGEHVDDHQVALAIALRDQGLVHYRPADAVTFSDLEAAAQRFTKRLQDPPPFKLRTRFTHLPQSGKDVAKLGSAAVDSEVS